MALQQARKIMECAICLETVRPPIRLCIEGHGSCGACIDDSDITQCPHCRSPMANVRRVVQLEQLTETLQNNLKVSCCHAYRGCQYVLLRKDVEAHELECKNRVFDCEGKKFCNWNCKWKGNYGDIWDHFKMNHARNACMQFTTISIMKINFNSNFVDLHLIPFKEGRQFFYYKHKVDCAAQKLYWAFQYVGPRNQAKYYKYEFEVYLDEVKKFKVTDYCESDAVDAEEIFKAEKCVVMSFRAIKNYLNNRVEQEGELKFRYRIMAVTATAR